MRQQLQCRASFSARELRLLAHAFMHSVRFSFAYIVVFSATSYQDRMEARLRDTSNGGSSPTIAALQNKINDLTKKLEQAQNSAEHAPEEVCVLARFTLCLECRINANWSTERMLGAHPLPLARRLRCYGSDAPRTSRSAELCLPSWSKKSSGSLQMPGKKRGVFCYHRVGTMLEQTQFRFLTFQRDSACPES